MYVLSIVSYQNRFSARNGTQEVICLGSAASGRHTDILAIRKVRLLERHLQVDGNVIRIFVLDDLMR